MKKSLGRFQTSSAGCSVTNVTPVSSHNSQTAVAREDGAAVRETISTKARTISNRIGADAEQATQRATAQMGLPAVAIAAGFLVFLMYPALSALGSAF